MKFLRKILFLAFLTVLLPSSGIHSQEKRDSIRTAALDDLRRRASAGDPKALFDLGTLYERGYADIRRDREAADSLYLKSAQAGYAPAQNLVGFMYYRGDGFRRDPHKALEWIEKAAQSDPKAWNNLGWLLMEGEGVEHDFQKAAYWLEKAADAGLPVAMSQLADLYRTGRGVESDTVKARCLYEKAITGGFADAEPRLLAMDYTRFRSMCGGEALLTGKRYRDMGAVQIAVTLFEISSEMGEPEAFTRLGDAYSRGEGVEYDHSRALGCYLRGARLGDREAMYVLGDLLEMFPDTLDGISGEVNPPPAREEKSAVYWREKAGDTE